MDDLEGLVVAEVTITRIIATDGELIDIVYAEDGDGDELGLAESLGMLRLAEHALLRESGE